MCQVPYVKVAPEDILKVQFPRFTTLDLRPTNTDISLAVAGLLTFFNSTTACLICAHAYCEHTHTHTHRDTHTHTNTHRHPHTHTERDSPMLIQHILSQPP